MTRIFVHPAVSSGLGLATNSFLPALSQKQITLEGLFRWAAQKGFSWIELRDPDVSMDSEKLSSLKALADSLSLRVHYAWNNPDLTREDRSFERGIRNAAVFGRGTCCRVVLAPGAIKGKKRYDPQDLAEICGRACEYGDLARRDGVTLCFENSMEPLEEMEKILLQCPNVRTALDAANFTSRDTAVRPEQEELLGYIRRRTAQIPYYHMKMTRQHEVLPSIEADGDFDVFAVIDALSANRDVLVCLELPPADHLSEIQLHVERSIETIKEMEARNGVK